MTKVLDSMLLAGVALATGACAEEKPARTPNVVFILADDLGWGDLSCYGQKKFRDSEHRRPRAWRCPVHTMLFGNHSERPVQIVSSDRYPQRAHSGEGKPRT